MEPSSDENLLAGVVDEFTDKLHRGEAVDPDDYVRRYPSLASVLQQILPAIRAIARPIPTATGIRVHSVDRSIGQRQALRNPGTTDGQVAEQLYEMETLQAGILQYEFLKLLGRGGMGSIYLARHKDLERLVAVKVVRSDLPLSPEVLSRFRSESRAIASLTHPNIVQVYEVGVVDQMPWFAMEYCGGGSLATNRNELLRPPVEVADLVRKIASAIHAAHEAGVIHRDLKPANILLSETGVPKVSDFGLVKLINEDTERTRTGTVLGTPSYMSPEQTLGDSTVISRAADIYSLGAILYDLLTGRPPFRAASLTQTIDQVRNLEPLRPQQLNSTIPRDLETICLKCLSKAPEDRYQTSAELAEDLQAFLDFRPIRARRMTLVERLTRFAWRNPTLTLSVSLLIIAIISGAGGMWWIETQARATADQQRQQMEADGLTDAILSAEVSQLPTLLKRMTAYSGAVESRLQRSLQSPNPPTDENSLRNVALALSSSDPKQLDRLWKRFPDLNPAEVEVYSEVLGPSNSDILNRCLAVLSGPLSPVAAPDSGTQESSGLHLRAACFAARWVPDSTLWSKAVADTDLVAELVRVSPAEFGDWRALLTPVLSHMVGPLERILANPDSSTQSRLFAFDLLAELAKSDVQRLFALLQRADESQFPIVLQALRRTPEEAAELAVRFLEDAVLNRTDPRQIEREHEVEAERIARVAALLVHLKHDQIVWNFLARSENPTVRSLLIEQFPKLRVSPLWLWQRFQDEADDGIRFALLLCLGGYIPEQIPSELKQDVSMQLHSLIPLENDPGVHSGIRWLLKTWGIEVASNEVSSRLEETSSSEILATGSATGNSDRRWFVNREGQHFTIVDAVSFQMGSAESLISRDPDEVLHVREINRRYAIAMYEVTAQQFQKFLDHREAVDNVDYRQIAAREVAAGQASFSEEPVGGISWYDAVAYCNWLSEQDGLPADQWCYEPNAQNQFASGMSVKSGFLNLAGYRLPTEAEWEFACRAGTNTSRYYGDSESILSQYAWHSPMADDRAHAVGLLRPNDFGLFDVLGNRYEWCHEVSRAYIDHPSAQSTDSSAAKPLLLLSDDHTSDSVQDVDRRVIRGGSFDFSARHSRSAYRTNDLASDRIRNNGLRPARTLTRHRTP